MASPPYSLTVDCACLRSSLVLPVRTIEVSIEETISEGQPKLGSMKECQCGVMISSRYKHCADCNDRQRNKRAAASSEMLIEIRTNTQKLDYIIRMLEAVLS